MTNPASEGHSAPADPVQQKRSTTRLDKATRPSKTQSRKEYPITDPRRYMREDELREYIMRLDAVQKDSLESLSKSSGIPFDLVTALVATKEVQEHLEPYAVELRDQGKALPWRQLCVHGYDNSPWLPFLPPEANYSLHGWGRYLFSQTPACKRGSIDIKQCGNWLLDHDRIKQRTSPADTLAKCCAAFAHSPLSLVIDTRAAIQCTSLAVKGVLGTNMRQEIQPYTIECCLNDVCAAGCGKELPEDPTYFPCFGDTVRYCSDDCAHKHLARVPEGLHIYMCCPPGYLSSHYSFRHVDIRPFRVSQANLKASLKPQGANSRTPKKGTRGAASSQERLITGSDALPYVQRTTSSNRDMLMLIFSQVRPAQACFPETHPFIKAYHELTDNFIHGRVTEEMALAELVALLYNNECIFPDARKGHLSMFPPRPFPFTPSAKPAGQASAPAEYAGQPAATSASQSSRAPPSPKAQATAQTGAHGVSAEQPPVSAPVQQAAAGSQEAAAPCPAAQSAAAVWPAAAGSHEAAAWPAASDIDDSGAAAREWGASLTLPTFTITADTTAEGRQRALQRKRGQYRRSMPVQAPSQSTVQTASVEDVPPTKPQPTPPLPSAAHPTIVFQATPATTHAPDSLCTTVQRLTEADLASISDLARNAWADASRDARPMLWHVRRRACERVCARMGLSAAGVQSLLWVASERGDAWGSLTALAQADPFGLCLPPELRTPYFVWAVLSELTTHVMFYALSEEAVYTFFRVFLSDRPCNSLGKALPTILSVAIHNICATCGKLFKNGVLCAGCYVHGLCSRECGMKHQSVGHCGIIRRCQFDDCEEWKDRSRAVLPLSFFDLATHKAERASDQQTPHTTDPTPHLSSPLQTDASATARCPAAAAVPAPSRSVSAQRTHTPVSAAQALTAEYRQCVEGNALLQRVAEVVMPRGAEREPESAAVMAAQQLLIAASGLLDARDLEEVLAAAEGSR